MKKRFTTVGFRMITFVLIITALSSCISQKKTIYLKNKNSLSSGSSTYENDLSTYKIEPGDFLYINVTSLNPTNMTSLDANEKAEYQLQSEMGIYLKSYQVTDSGFINFPVVGKILVAGLSIDQTRDKIQSIIDDYYQLASVTVKLVNFKISILGEVNRPGTYSVYQDKLNIFQALSLGGDITNYGNRQNINIIRKTSTGGTEILKINLLNDSLLELPGFYLQPEDVIYVEPMKSKAFAFTSFPYSIVLSTITTTLLILNFFK